MVVSEFGLGGRNSLAIMTIPPRWILSFRRWLPALGVALISSYLAVLLKLSSGAYEIGADEGMELAKACLLQQHPDLIDRCWNDQPWLFSRWIVSVGADAFGGRLLVGALSLVGLLSMGWIAGRDSMAAGFLAPGLMLLWPKIPEFSLSAMLEWPAWCCGLLAAALLPERDTVGRRWRVAAACGVFAVAVGLKLTVLILGPALLARWWIGRKGIGAEQVGLASGGLRDAAPEMAIGCTAFLLVSLLILVTGPRHDPSVMWASHATTRNHPEALNIGLDLIAIARGAPGIVMAAALGLIQLLLLRAWRSLAVPVTLGVTALVVHLFHHPFWWYYEMHFGIALSLLGGIGVPAAIRRYRESSPTGTDRRAEGWMLVGSLALAMIAAVEIPRHYSEIQTIIWSSKIQQNSLVQTARRYARPTDWAYAASSELFHHVGVAQPPEITVVPLKRFWNGSISRNAILEIVRRYDCGMLLLREDRELKLPEWKALLAENFVAVYSDRFQTLFVHRRMNPTRVEPSGDWQRRLGVKIDASP